MTPLNNSEWFTEVYREAVEKQDSQPIAALSLKTAKKLHEETTPFQKIEIFETPFWGKILIMDGCVMLTERDNFVYHEMLSHPALFAHPNPENVVIVGGGDCGTIREVLKHTSVKQAVQVEIDERVTRLCEQYFPELCTSNSDPRAQFVFQDAIEWFKSCPTHSQDVIMIDSTDPVGPAAPLFQQDFYGHCIKALKNDGIFVQQSESPFFNLNILQSLRKDMKKAGFTDVQTLLFPQPTYPSGCWSVTLARKADHFSTVREKNIETHYYNTGIHSQAKNLPEFLKNALT